MSRERQARARRNTTVSDGKEDAVVAQFGRDVGVGEEGVLAVFDLPRRRAGSRLMNARDRG